MQKSKMQRSGNQRCISPYLPPIVSDSVCNAVKEPGIDTKSVPGLFFICWDISVCFGDIPFIFAIKY